MGANISTTLSDWSITAASNQPDGTDTADIDAEFQAIQAAVRKYVRSIGADIASASTVNLAAATGEFVSVTGTTTVTSFGTVGAGLRYIVRFVSALTVTHNATSLICPGGVSLAVKANDVIWLESLGSGNWRILAHMNAKDARVWNDVAASRALDTEYTNNYHYPIDVSASVGIDNGRRIAWSVGGVVVCFDSGIGAGYRNIGPVTVPPGSTYKLYCEDGVGSMVIGVWAELY